MSYVRPLNPIVPDGSGWETFKCDLSGSIFAQVLNGAIDYQLLIGPTPGQSNWEFGISTLFPGSGTITAQDKIHAVKLRDHQPTSSPAPQITLRADPSEDVSFTWTPGYVTVEDTGHVGISINRDGIYVEDYYSGGSDWSPAIAAAHQARLNSGPGRIHYPSGTLDISAGIPPTIGDGYDLVGQGGSSTILRPQFAAGRVIDFASSNNRITGIGIDNRDGGDNVGLYMRSGVSGCIVTDLALSNFRGNDWPLVLHGALDNEFHSLYIKESARGIRLEPGATTPANQNTFYSPKITFSDSTPFGDPDNGIFGLDPAISLFNAEGNVFMSGVIQSNRCLHTIEILWNGDPIGQGRGNCIRDMWLEENGGIPGGVGDPASAGIWIGGVPGSIILADRILDNMLISSNHDHPKIQIQLAGNGDKHIVRGNFTNLGTPNISVSGADQTIDKAANIANHNVFGGVIFP